MQAEDSELQKLARQYTAAERTGETTGIIEFLTRQLLDRSEHRFKFLSKVKLLIKTPNKNCMAFVLLGLGGKLCKRLKVSCGLVDIYPL